MTESGQGAALDANHGVVFVMEVANRPGIVHAIAAVFSHRGLSMGTLAADTHRRPPRIVVQFRGTARQCRMVERVLARLHDVEKLRCLDESDAEIGEVAICRVVKPLPELPGISVQSAGDRSLLSGSRAAVEAALGRLEADGCVEAVGRSLLLP